jgi:hypothetical protein
MIKLGGDQIRRMADGTSLAQRCHDRAAEGAGPAGDDDMGS